jgi:predicted transposase YdaD
VTSRKWRVLAKTQTQNQTNSKIAAIIELIETVVVYKFPELSREAIERMLGLSELRQTKVYQEALQEGRQEGEQSLILRQLVRRIGKVPSKTRSQIQALSLEKLESLGEALLDFTGLEDLQQWLDQN